MKIKIDNIKKYLPYLFGGLLFILALNIKKIRLFFERKKAIISTETANNQKVDINGSSITLNLDTIASAIYYSFYNSNGKSRWNEDEQAAIDNIIKVPKENITRLSAVYASRFGKILKDDLISGLRSSQWKKIEYLFN